LLSVRLVVSPESIKELAAKAETVHAALAIKVRELVHQWHERAAEKVSGPAPGAVLNVKTGALRRSLKERFEDEGGVFVGTLYSSGDVKYAAIHEYGGVINIPEITPTKAQALHFFYKGKWVFAMRAKAHSVTMPERSFVRSSLRELAPQIELELRETLREAISK
jgi:phage gpG-like protein